MAKFDYSASKALADRLLNQFGASLTFTRQTGETFDPATGTTSATEETFSRDVVWLDYDNDEIDGSIVQRGDARLLIQGEVKVDDRVERDGENWKVVTASPLNPAGTLIYTEAQVRN